MEQICGNCRWHFAHDEAVEQAGWKNCCALPYPECIDFYTRPTATCNFPLLFAPSLPPISGVLNIKL
jgi:hypothetical protein